MAKTSPLDPKDEFAKTLELVVQILLGAKSHLAIGRGIVNMITSEPAISGVAPTFWTLTIYSHFDSAQLSAFKLFDTQPRAVTIPHLLLMAEANPGLFPFANPEQVAAIVKTARFQITNIQDALDAINARRNRVIA